MSMIIEVEEMGQAPTPGAGFTPAVRTPAEVAAPRLLPEDGLAALVKRGRAGELDAQSELVRRYRPRLMGFVRARIRDREAVEDIVQAISAKLVRRLPALRDSAVFEPWLFTLARNTILDHLRRSRCRPVLIGSEAALEEMCDPNADDRSREILEFLDDAVRDMSTVNRRILQEIISGASYRQIARAERISLPALKVRLYRLRLELRARRADARNLPGPSNPQRCSIR